MAATATISEKAMCMLGTAAYGLTRRLVNDESWFVLVKAAIVSVKPVPREHPRRGRREQDVTDQRQAHRHQEHVADEVEVVVPVR